MDAGIDFDQPIPGYEILQLLGSGGTSSVYKARQRSLDRMVALKVLRKSQFQHKVTLERLAKEARLLAQLSHPSIVRSIDFGEAGDLLYFTMEFVDGRSAKDLVEERGRLEPREAVIVADRVAEALEYAAARGIIHRDVKPGNILLGRDGSVRLSDFGLARVLLDRSVTREGFTVGTPQYMSPEQVRNSRRVDLRSDLYSLGATLYHLATGQPPFEGESVSEVLHAVLYGRPVPPEHWDEDFPEPLSQVIARLMARNPARRYGAASSLRRDLRIVHRNLTSGEEGEVSGLSWEESAQRPSRWGRGAALAAGAAALVVVGALIHQAFFLDPVSDAGGGTARAAEVELLRTLEGELDGGTKGGLELLAALQQFVDEGTLTARSGAERDRLEGRLEKAVQGAIEAAGERTAVRARERLAVGRLGPARARLAADFEELLAEELGSLAALEYLPQLRFEDDSQRALRRVQDSVVSVESEVEAEVDRAGQRALDDYREQRLQPLLDNRDFAGAKAAADQFPAALRRSLPAALKAAVQTSGLVWAGPGGFEEVEEGLPGGLRERIAVREAEGVADLEEHCARVLREFQNQLIARIDQLRFEFVAEIGRIDDPGTLLEQRAEDWIQRMERELLEQLLPEGRSLAEVPAEGRNWREPLEEWQRQIVELIATRQEQQLRELVDAFYQGPPTLDELLRERAVERVRARLEAVDAPLLAERLGGWDLLVGDMERLLADFSRQLERRVDSEVQLVTQRGAQLKGRLVRSGAGGFSIVVRRRVPLEIRDVALASLLEWTGAEYPATSLAALHYYWGRGREADRARVDELLAGLSETPPDPVVGHLKDLREREQREAAEGSARRREDADALQAEFLAAEEAGDPARARPIWERLQSEYRDSEAYASLADRRTEIARWLEQGGRRQELERLLEQLFPRAHERRALPDGTAVVRYEFDREEELVDFQGGLAQVVEDGALVLAEVGPDREQQALLFGLRLALPTAADADYSVILEVSAPLAEPRRGRYLLLELDHFSVALIRPEHRIGAEPYPWQYNAWSGGLDDWRTYFYEPDLPGVRPARGAEGSNVTGPGLKQGARHQLEFRYRAKPTAQVEIFLDGEPVNRVALDPPPRRSGSGRLELRTLSALRIHSLGFAGRIREE